MAYLADLKTRRANIAAELAALTATAKGGGINSSGAGTSLDHVGYKDGLLRELETLDKLIATAEVTEVDGGGGVFEEDIEVGP